MTQKANHQLLDYARALCKKIPRHECWRAICFCGI